MSAKTRWVEINTSAEGTFGDGGQDGKGTRGYSLATSSIGDSATIGSANNRLYFNVDGVSAPYITIVSGTNMDPRFIAKDITEKIHNLGKNNIAFDQAQCVWENNKLKLYSGTLGVGSEVTVVSGTSTGHLELGFGTTSENTGEATTNTYAGGITISGTYDGFFDELYHIVMCKEQNIGIPAKGGSNNYTGSIYTGGVFNAISDVTYNITIDASNGTTMGGGIGNVPVMSWTCTGDTAGSVELLYPNYWYNVGTQGAMVKFTDAVFNTCNPAWTITCTQPVYVEGTNTSGPTGVAKYIWGSSRGDDSEVAITASSDAFTQLGTRGLYIKFDNGASNFSAGDEFFAVCTPPQPTSYDITNLNYGNVTVSTESQVKCIIFEIISGAVEISTVKFGLQSHGNFEHHYAGNSDTKFRFGTLGPGNTAGSAPINNREWRANVVAADINSDIAPSYMSITKENLMVVSDADDCESIGSSSYMGMVSDPMFVNIKLGASEVGANSSINNRLFFDYS